MPLSQAQLQALITVFRKETEDLITSMNIEMFQIQYGETTILEDETKTINLGSAYPLVTDFEIVIFEASDTDGVNIKDALIVGETKTVSSFSIYSPRACTVRWQTLRRTPLINFWT